MAGQCESCGSLLPLPDTDGFSTCLSCGRNHRTAADKPDESKTKGPTAATFDLGGGIGAQPWTPDLTVTVTRPGVTVRKGRGIGCFLTVFVLLGAMIAGIVLFTRSVGKEVSKAFDTVRELNTSNLSLYPGSLLFLEDPAAAGKTVDGGGSAPEIVGLTYDGSSNTHFVARAVLAEGEDTPEPMWTSEPLPKNTSNIQLAQIGDTVFVGLGDELQALDVETGVQRWKADLPDKVGVGCDACFLVAGDTLMVVTDDDQINAFGTGSATPRWTRKLVSTGGEVSLSEAGLVVIDQDPAVPGSTVVSVLDPASGTPRSAVTPECPPQNGSFPTKMNFSDLVVAVPGTTDLVSTVSFGSTCIVRWDGNTGQIRWVAFTDLAGHFEHDDVLATGDRLFVPVGDGTMASVDLGSGATSRLALPADVTAHPVAVLEGRLIAETTTTRGTQRGGLAAWDLATGQPIWQTAMPDGSKPFSNRVSWASETLFPDSPLSTTVVAGPVLRLATFSGDDYTGSLRTVDVASGTLGEPQKWVLGEGPGTASVTVEKVLPTGLAISFDNSYAMFLPFAKAEPALSWPVQD
ncbi:MAG: PQQ-binding-like beta-propeller repeat protein [Microthrixaceae bacterium]|jgi:outer membrane protein assembly factor BamB|nr:PQQ-binding-like beta-propeller repeat protein [Microthrixaceae bacterium]